MSQPTVIPSISVNDVSIAKITSLTLEKTTDSYRSDLVIQLGDRLITLEPRIPLILSERQTKIFLGTYQVGHPIYLTHSQNVKSSAYVSKDFPWMKICFNHWNIKPDPEMVIMKGWHKTEYLEWGFSNTYPSMKVTDRTTATMLSLFLDTKWHLTTK